MSTPTATHRALNTPEVVQLIAGHMDKGEMSQLSRTNRFLHLWVEPLLYKDITVNFNTQRTTILASPDALRALARNISAVRSLSIDRIEVVYLSYCFRAFQQAITQESQQSAPLITSSSTSSPFLRVDPLPPMNSLRELTLFLARHSYDSSCPYDSPTTNLAGFREMCGILQMSEQHLVNVSIYRLINHNRDQFNALAKAIASKIFNVLVTELWRLDRDCSSERGFTAGSCSGAFSITGNEDVRIFIDKRSFDLASDVVSGRHIPRFGIDLLRQIRSHLCSADSYRMGRASSYLISNMVSAQAASIFTLSMVYPASGDGSIGSSLLSRVAKEVNAKGREAVLQKVWVLDALNRVNDKDKSVGVFLSRHLSDVSLTSALQQFSFTAQKE